MKYPKWYSQFTEDNGQLKSFSRHVVSKVETQYDYDLIKGGGRRSFFQVSLYRWIRWKYCLVMLLKNEWSCRYLFSLFRKVSTKETGFKVRNIFCTIWRRRYFIFEKESNHDTTNFNISLWTCSLCLYKVKSKVKCEM